MDKETRDEYAEVNVTKLAEALTEQAWMEDTRQSDTSDLYHYELTEMPYPMPAKVVKKTVKEYWRAVFDRLYNRYKTLIESYQKPKNYGNNTQGEETGSEDNHI